MSTTKINQLPAAASVNSGDYLAIDNTSGVSQKITAGQLVNVDPTLSVSGRPADAKATGDAIAAEQTAREQAVSAEAAAREAVGAEVSDLRSALNAPNPLQALLFDGYYWSKGDLTSHKVTYESPKVINNQLNEYNSATASQSTPNGILSFEFNKGFRIKKSTGNYSDLVLIIKSNYDVSDYNIRLSTGVQWGAGNSVKTMQRPGNISAGINVWNPTFVDTRDDSTINEYLYLIFTIPASLNNLQLEVCCINGDVIYDYLHNSLSQLENYAFQYSKNLLFPNPLQALLFDGYTWSRGNYQRHIVEYAKPKYITDDISAYNSGVIAADIPNGLLSFKFNEMFEVDKTTGNYDDIVLFIRTNQNINSVRTRLSTDAQWGAGQSVKISQYSVNLKTGINLYRPVFVDNKDESADSKYSYLIFQIPKDTTNLQFDVTCIRGNIIYDYLQKTSSEYGFSADLVFWGDSLTFGAGGNGTTYPAVCANELSMTHINCGVGGETPNTIAARQGGNNVIIPAGHVNGTYGINELEDTFGYHINPLRQGNGSNTGNKLFVNNYECNLTITQSSPTSDDAVYTISGYTGPDLVIPTPAYLAGRNMNGKIVVIFVGQNTGRVNGSGDYKARCAIIDSMISMIGHDRYVILTLSTLTASDRAQDEEYMLYKYGVHLFKTREMLSQYGMVVEGLTPTAADTEQIAQGMVPDSLRSDSTHLNAYGYEALGKMLADKIRALGYAD